MTTNHEELCKRLHRDARDVEKDYSSAIASDMEESANLIEAHAARIQQQALENITLFDQCSEALERVKVLEARIAAAKKQRPVAHIEETPVGPRLFVNDVLVHSWFGCGYDESVKMIAEQINNAHPPIDTASEGVIRFSGIVLEAHRNDGWPGDVDGGVLQQAALDCGLIEERRVTERCGETCTCAESAEFPTVCYFNTEAGKACIDAATNAGHGEPQNDR
jgi:hypothetical protein